MPILPPAQPELEVSISSNGMSKGISQTGGPQAVARGRLTWDHIYVAALAKNVTDEEAKAEVQFSIGGSFVRRGTTLTGSMTYKRAITSIGSADEQAIELGVGASRAFGNVIGRAQFLFSPDDIGQATASAYAELGMEWGIGARTKVGASLGRRARSNHVDYVCANLGLSYELGKRLTAELRGYATNRGDSGDRYKPRLVASVQARF